MQVNNNLYTLINNETIIKEINLIDNSESLKRRRKDIFFTAINLEKNNLNIDLVKKHSDIENKSFYDQIINADFFKVQNYLIDQVDKLIKLDKFYCDASHLTELNSFIVRVKAQTENTEGQLKNDLTTVLYILYELNRVLENLKYEIQTQLSTTSAISKQAINLRLNECLGCLDKCWPGISSRLTHEYEFLISIQQGLSGKIYLIKKDIFKEFTIEYINKIKTKNPTEFLIGNEVHLFNSLNNRVAGILGLNNIEDRLAVTHLDFQMLQQFIELLQIEISPGIIANKLAEEIYNNLVDILTQNSMQSWLIADKTDSELAFEFVKIENAVFAPANMVFDVTANKKLTIDKILDITEKNENLIYSLKRSKEKINLWVADSLMPNTDKILVANIFNVKENKYFSIKTIDYIFFWVCSQQYFVDDLTIEDNIDYSNYISLQLFHIMQIDFTNFDDINHNDSCLFEYNKKRLIIISLVTQAMLQTNNIVEIIDFLINDAIKTIFNNIPLLRENLEKVFSYKVANKNLFDNFQETDILTDTAAINKVELLLHIACCCGNYKIVNKCITFIVYNNKLNTTEKIKLIQANNGLYWALKKGKYKVVKEYIELVLAYNGFNSLQKLELIWAKTIDGCSGLSIALINGYYKAVKEYIKLVLAYDGFNPWQKLEFIQAKTTDGYPGLFIALIKGYYKAVKEYIELVLACDEFNGLQKLKLIQAQNSYGVSGLYAVLEKGQTKAIKEYIELILTYNGFDSLQKLVLIQGNTRDGCSGLLIALENGHDKAIKVYIELVLAYDGFNLLQKLKIMMAQSSDGFSGLYQALWCGQDKAVKEYIKLVLAYDEFNSLQKLKLIQVKIQNRYLGLAAALLKGSYKAVKEYIELVLAYDGFNLLQKLKLIKAQSIHGFSGLYAALNKGQDKAVKVYIELVLAYDGFNLVQKLELIQAKTSNGNVGLTAALVNGGYKAVKEYIELVLAYDGFNILQKFKLIKGKSSNDFSGLYIALQKGQDKSIKQYIELVLAYDGFNLVQKLELIQTTTRHGYTGLFIALINGHDASIKQYIELVLAYDGFNSLQKLKFLKIQSNAGFSGLYEAFLKGQDKAIKTYIELVLTSDKFNPLQKLELVQIKKIGNYVRLNRSLEEDYDRAISEYIKSIINYKEFNIKQKIQICRKITSSCSRYENIVQASNLTDKEKIQMLSPSRCTTM